MPQPVVHFEVIGQDPTRLRKYFGELFGWEFDVPSPVSGKVLKLAGAPGDVILTGAVLAEFELDPNLPQRAEAQDTGHNHGGAHASTGEPAHDVDDDVVVASDDGGEISDGPSFPEIER